MIFYKKDLIKYLEDFIPDNASIEITHSITESGKLFYHTGYNNRPTSIINSIDMIDEINLIIRYTEKM